MQTTPPAPSTTWLGHGDKKTSQRFTALAASLALISCWAPGPALAEEHGQQTAPPHDELGAFESLGIPNLPVSGKIGAPGKTGPPPKNPATKAPVKATATPPQVPQLDPKADPKGVLNQALKAYESGHYGQAASILASDIQANPDDGTVHYYMGLALKKQGYDMPALHELEKAARLCPPEMIKRFADEQVGNLDEPEPLGPNTAAKGGTPPVLGGDWLGGIGNSISQMFGGKPAAQTNTSTAASTTGSSASTTSSSDHPGSFPPLSFFPAMPDVMGQIKDAVRQGKKMLREHGSEAPRSTSGGGIDFSRRQIGEAEIMHMEAMQALVQKSHAMKVPEWASDPAGLTAFEQAPEGTPEWDYWIGRFKRSFQHVLLRRLNSEAGDEVRGAAACIFSVDRSGNLHGQVYASTADPVLNKCLIEAIRDLNHSRILVFPSTSRITGWNFQMSWNFGFPLAIVRAYKAQQERETQIQALLKIVQEDTAIKATIAAGKEKRARAKKLAAEKALKAKMVKREPEAKVEVAGRVLTPGAERELKAVALELKDLTPVAPGTALPNADPFATIDDRTINSWPDLNR